MRSRLMMCSTFRRPVVSPWASTLCHVSPAASTALLLPSGCRLHIQYAVTMPSAAVRVGLHALYDALYLVALHRAGHQPVKAVRAAYSVCLDQPHTQVIRRSRLMLHR